MLFYVSDLKPANPDFSPCGSRVSLMVYTGQGKVGNDVDEITQELCKKVMTQNAAAVICKG